MSKNSTLSRRGLLAGIPAAAAVTAATGAAVEASVDDPIFAVIKTYKQADRECLVSYDDFDRTCGAAWEAHGMPPQEYGEAWDAWCERAGVIRLRERHDDAKNGYLAASADLGATIPTTLAGVAALLTMYVEDDPWEAGERCWHEPVVRNAAAALKKLAEARA